MKQALLNFSESPIYLLWMVFIGAFPIITAMLSIDSSRRFIIDRRDEPSDSPDELLPDEGDIERARREFETLSVLIPARNEEALLASTIESVIGLDWPRVELIVIDDGSTDRTFEIARGFISNPETRGQMTSGPALARESVTIRILRRPESHGKASGLNLALAEATGEIVLGLDADGRVDRRVAELMIPHFVRYPRVAAVTGNPRVANVGTVLARLQAIEFSSTVGVLRRAQAGWGRINTVSGICVMFRRQVPLDLGGFDPGAATEDIMMTWKAQLDGWDIFYEPRALFAMHAPLTLRDWFRQRRRWGRGLGETLRVSAKPLLRRQSYRMWPVALESSLSIVWYLLLVLGVAFWAVAAAAGVPNLGNSPLVNHWGIIVIIISILQIVWGVRIDTPNDPGIKRMLWVAPLYPLLYWLFSAMAGVSGAIPGLIRGPRGEVVWDPIRVDPDPDGEPHDEKILTR